jgi:hypothetical protein
VEDLKDTTTTCVGSDLTHRPFSLSIIFMDKARSLLNRGVPKRYSLLLGSQVPALLVIIRLERKGFQGSSPLGVT